MVFYLGVVSPPTSVVTPPGYELSATERRYLAARLPNQPVTVQHRQIQQHVDALDADGLPLTSLNLRLRVPHVGVVLSAFEHRGWLWAIFRVDDAADLVLSLIRGGHLLCLSLTHTLSGPEITPIELTLCSVPARPLSYVYHECTSLEAAFNYKASVLADAITYKMNVDPVAPEAVPSKLAAILASLTPENRSLVEARFTEIATAADDARVSQQETLARLNKLMEIKETDKKMFATHFDYLLSQMPAETQAKYAVNTATRDVLTQSPPEVLHHVNQLIRCASASMITSTTEPAAPVAKRVRVEPPMSEPTGTVLGRALADTFRI